MILSTPASTWSFQLISEIQKLLKIQLWRCGEAEYFSREGWTIQITLNRFRKLVFGRTRFAMLQARRAGAASSAIHLIRPTARSAQSTVERSDARRFRSIGA